MPRKFHPALLQLVAFAPVLWWFGKRLDDGNDEPLGLLTLGLALVLVWRDRRSLHASPCDRIIGAVLAFATPRTPAPPDVSPGPAVFTFDGLVLPLHPLPATDAEMAFAKSFPGTLASYQWGDDQVILRRLTEATRRLHPSRDCLQAAGFETTEAITVTLGDGSRWARFSATRDGIRRTVHERITSGRDGAAWTDVSAWYWAALRRPLNGPWQAETVISLRR